ncbi:hypothetical protein B5K05_13195 [Rhizobium phaseoli]|nr:hypothetical protein B5K04_13170 [Rhizobium phaseoli]RDJ14085.1 hypothetical protein B5K05_13195 [Rhizobium phaseoli]
MSNADRSVHVLKTVRERLHKHASGKKEKSPKVLKDPGGPLVGMQTYVFSVVGMIESDQVEASEKEYCIEVRVRTRRRSDNLQDPSAAALQSLLDDQMKRHLHAIAERYPQVPEAKRAPDEGAARSTDLLQLLRTLG